MKRGEGVGSEQCGSGRSLLTWLKALRKDACALKRSVRGKGNLQALVSPCPPTHKGVFAELYSPPRDRSLTEASYDHVGSRVMPLNVKKHDTN